MKKCLKVVPLKTRLLIKLGHIIEGKSDGGER